MNSLSDRLLLLALFLGSHCFATEIEDVSLASNINYGYANTAEQSMQASLELIPSLDISFNKSTSFVGSVRIWLDSVDELEPGRPDRQTYSTGSLPLAIGSAGSADIRDMYFEMRFDKGVARFGKQPIVWGQLDGIKVLDLINPQDFREFILDDFADSRISLWSAYLDLSFGDWRGEFALVPDSTGHAIPESGAWFELTAPRFRYGATDASAGLPLTTVQPSHSIDELATGIRLSREIATLNLSIVAYSGMDPEWLGRVRSIDGQAAIERFQKRREAYGFSIEKTLGSVILRSEYAYQPDRVFNIRSGGELLTTSRDQHRAAVGVDIDAPLGVFVNIQYLIDSISSAPAGLVRPMEDRIATLYLRKALAYDSLLLEARWYHSFTEDDELHSFGLEYILNDSASIKIEAQAFSGDREGLFGQFATQDRIALSLAHRF